MAAQPKKKKNTPTARKRTRKTTAPAPVPPKSEAQPTGPGEPAFAEPVPSADPTRFVDTQSDTYLYAAMLKNLQRIPPPRDPNNMTLSLETVWGKQGPAKLQAISKAGQIVFHSVGDTGPTTGPKTITEVADKMVADFDETDPADLPAFFFHLGDVVYSFGETQYYYDQFYEPYRNYNAPIFAIPGNHDGVIYKNDPETSLQAFLENFCAPSFQKTPEAGNLSRTAMIQPGVYFTLDAPFVKIIGLWSNDLEDPGVISSEGNSQSPVDDQQLKFLLSQLQQIKSQNYQGAVILAVHHPPITIGGNHGGSPHMMQDIDNQCQAAGFYPHAILSGHAHNYQRYTRRTGQTELPFIISGGGGHNVQQLGRAGQSVPLRVPYPVTPQITLESYSTNYGYLRVIVNASILRIEYHNVIEGQDSKSPADVCTVDLKSRALVANKI